MAKVDDARLNALKALFETDDTISQVTVWDLLDAIQEAAQDHGHSASGGSGSGTGDAAQIGAGALKVTDEAQGDILYRAAAVWARLPAGASGLFLKTQGAAADPAWAAVVGTCIYGTQHPEVYRTNQSWVELDVAYRFTFNARAATYYLCLYGKRYWETAYYRLYNVTDAVAYSEITTTSSNYNWLTSASFVLPSGVKQYTIQVKTGGASAKVYIHGFCIYSA